jgi:glutaconate CoA-transferase subunit A
MTGAIRTSVVTDAAGALEGLQDGATVGLGGILTSGHPMTLVRELIRRGLRDLTVVAPVAGLDADLLIAAGCVGRLVTSYVGAEGLAGVGPAYRAAALAGTVEIVDVDEAHCVAGLRAAGQGLPFLPWLGGLGTDLPTVNPQLVVFEDPIEGRPLIAVPAIRLDVALIHADRSDAYGNVQFGGTGDMDPLLAAAASRVVVQVDHVVENDVIRRAPADTHYWRDTAVVHAPWGTHPYASRGLEADADHLRAYAGAVRAAGKGDPEPLQAYLDTHVHDAPTHPDYLEAIGIRRIAGLVR